MTKEQRAVMESRRIVSSYSGVFDRPPRDVPAFKFVDGPITGNGDIGLTLSGPPEKQRYWISKNDFWKSGPDFKQCGPSVIGGIDIRIDELKNASYRVEQALYKPVLSSAFSLENKRVTMDATVEATANVIVLTLRSDGQPVDVNLCLWVQDGYGSETARGQEGPVVWVTRKFNTKDLLYPTEATIAVRCLETGTTAFTLAPGKPVTVVLSVMTNHESKDYHETVLKKVAGIGSDDVERLASEHAQWWQKFWAESYVEIEDKLIEKFYYGSHYLMACCSRNVNFPPGLYGNWITANRTAWAGDIHLNYNHEAPYWALWSSNHGELTEPYDAPLLEHLPIFVENARKYLNKKGAYADVGIGPKGLSSCFFDLEGMHKIYGKEGHGADGYESLAGQPMFLGQKSNAIFASMNMILRYHYTYDEAYARKVYPYLSAVADFWEDYLEFEPFDKAAADARGRQGRYVSNDDAVGEVGPWDKKGWQNGYGDRNPITSIGFLRVFLKAMIEISGDLNVDRNRHAKWEHILAHLSDFPVVEDKAKGRKRFRACEGGTGSALNSIGVDWGLLHALVFPAPNIGLGSDPSELKMIRDDMRDWDQEWLTECFSSLFIGAARVGYDPAFTMAKARERIAKFAYHNFWLPTGGGGIEHCSAIPGMINEMMLQSHNGVIRVFPVFPGDQKASFYRLRTFGAFLFSSAVENGTIQYVRIESEKGRDCTLQNPWPGRAVRVIRDGKPAEAVTGDRLVLKTRSGETFEIEP